MEEQEIRLVKELQKGLKLERRPFLRIAKELGLSESEVIDRIDLMQKSGVIRRLGVAIKPEKAGFTSCALVAWNVPQDQIEKVGKLMAEFPEISHCYEREITPTWQWSIYTMIHATTPEHLADIVSLLQKESGIDDYRIFKTVRELKKTSMTYFTEVKHDHKS